MKITVNYIDNEELTKHLVEHQNNIKEAKSKGLPKPIPNNYIGESFLKIANNLSKRPNFYNYSFREEMVGDAIENCFHRSTKVATLEYGCVEIENIVGKEVTVKTIDGKWRKSLVKSYGQQMLYEYGFDVSDNPTLDDEIVHKVISTSNHRWFLISRENESYEKVVTDLRVHDKLKSASFIDGLDKDAIIHGMIYSSTTNSSCYNINYDNSIDYTKLPETTNPSYISGFIYGWELTRVYNVFTPEEEEWLRNNIAYSGFIIVSMYEMDNCFSISIGNSDDYSPKVRYIKEYGVDEVFCLEEPETHSFVLGNGLLTGNCFQYYENFDPVKFDKPFAYFTLICWRAFLRRIAKEKKQQYVKYKAIQNFGVLGDEEMDELDDSDREQVMLYDNIYEFISTYEDKNFIKKNEIKQQPKGIEKFIDE